MRISEFKAGQSGPQGESSRTARVTENPVSGDRKGKTTGKFVMVISGRKRGKFSE